MAKRSPKEIALRIGFILVGVMGAGLGCACYIMADLGSDPVTAFVQGLGTTLGGTPGLGTNLLNISAFVILLIVNRKLVHIGTFLYTFLLGSMVDIFIALLGFWIGAEPAMPLRVVLIVLGTLAIALGLGLYQAAELGIGPTDGINQTIVAKTGLNYRVERILFDLVMAVSGWLLGGVIGLGTIVGMLGVGPVMVPTLEWGKRRITSILKKRRW